MAKKQDLRVIKTRRALESAMLRLLTGTPFAKITVNELCAQAMVSRSAFYAHFQDKYDLAAHCLKRLSDQLFEETRRQGLKEHLRALLERISRDSRVFVNLIIAEYDGELMALIREGFLKELEAHRSQLLSALPQPQEISVLFHAAGLTSAIIHWIRTGLVYSVDEMAACLGALLPPVCEETQKNEA
ncbi:MAG: TetR/AcrR family transcriptional regulator [Clostridiales bacterium]|nr:TetR/AcrR family transcriptional regulator [Clostridiales bacterium]